jgi:hypothetical protein
MFPDIYISHFLNIPLNFPSKFRFFPSYTCFLPIPSIIFLPLFPFLALPHFYLTTRSLHITLILYNDLTYHLMYQSHFYSQYIFVLWFRSDALFVVRMTTIILIKKHYNYLGLFQDHYQFRH